MQDVQNIEKDFAVVLKMIVVIDKKQMYDSVIAGKENASEEWHCIISVFLTSFHVYFVFGYTYFCVYALKLLSGFFWLFSGQGLAFFGEDRLATLLQTGKATDMSELQTHYCTTPGQ